MFSLSDYDYELPEASIAQIPEQKRDQSKLLVLNRKTGDLLHHTFHDIYDFLFPGDVLVVNNTEVIPGRLFGHKDSGGKVEILILDYAHGKKNKSSGEGCICQCLVKAAKGPKPGALLHFDPMLSALVMDVRKNIYTLKFLCEDEFETILYRIGHVPLPPYIKRSSHEAACNDRDTYQTVYAARKGAIAAPTAGLHFTQALLDKIASKGITIATITLHVGYGTFLPVRVSDIRQHPIHSETYCVSPEASKIINAARAEGRRVIAVGTTSVRTLEYASDNNGFLTEGAGNCDLFIYPGYRFKVVDAMITNFHLPRSTLLMLVSAFAGKDRILNAYQEAIRCGYRFYSYGDAMLIH